MKIATIPKVNQELIAEFAKLLSELPNSLRFFKLSIGDVSRSTQACGISNTMYHLLGIAHVFMR